MVEWNEGRAIEANLEWTEHNGGLIEINSDIYDFVLTPRSDGETWILRRYFVGADPLLDARIVADVAHGKAIAAAMERIALNGWRDPNRKVQKVLSER